MKVKTNNIDRNAVDVFAFSHALCEAPAIRAIFLLAMVCRKKFNSLKFSLFFLRFFQLSHNLCEGGYICDFCRALGTRQF